MGCGVVNWERLATPPECLFTDPECIMDISIAQGDWYFGVCNYAMFIFRLDCIFNAACRGA